MIRQTIEMAHPMYDIICKASPSTLDMFCKNNSSNNGGITTNTCTTVVTPTAYWQTFSPPATSTSTAKLVRWVLRHCTDVTLPSVLMPLVVIPSVSQFPYPTLYQKYYFKHWVSTHLLQLTDQRISSKHTSNCVCRSPTECNKHSTSPTDQVSFILTVQYAISVPTYWGKIKMYWDGVLL